MDNIKSITPDLSQIKDNTPALKIGNQYFANGIGGNFIPSGFANVAAGYVTVSDSAVILHDITNNTTKVIDKLYIADTGVDEPAYQGSGGGSAAKYYKCASVNSDSTWHGNLAIIDDTTGVWSFSSDSTELEYSRITPVVGSVYDEECTFMVSRYKTALPEDGLIFYAPLQFNTQTAETGQTLSSGGTPVYGSWHGLPCVHLPSGTWMYSYLDGANALPAFTMTTWRYAIDGNTYGYHYGITTDVWNQQLIVDNSTIYYDSGSYITNMSGNSDGVWYFEVTVWDGQTLKFYRDNDLKGERSISSGVIKGNNVVFGAEFTDGGESENDIYLAAFRVYNRALSAAEISMLASEFTPTNN